MTRDAFRRACRRADAGRRRPDAVFLGVCAAVAARAGINAWWVRAVVFVALASAPLGTIALYLLAAVLLARHPAGRWRA